MNKQQYTDIYDNLKCSPEFRNKMEKLLSEEPSDSEFTVRPEERVKIIHSKSRKTPAAIAACAVFALCVTIGMYFSFNTKDDNTIISTDTSIISSVTVTTVSVPETTVTQHFTKNTLTETAVSSTAGTETVKETQSTYQTSSAITASSYEATVTSSVNTVTSAHNSETSDSSVTETKVTEHLATETTISETIHSESETTTSDTGYSETTVSETEFVPTVTGLKLDISERMPYTSEDFPKGIVNIENEINWSIAKKWLISEFGDPDTVIKEKYGENVSISIDSVSQDRFVLTEDFQIHTVSCRPYKLLTMNPGTYPQTKELYKIYGPYYDHLFEKINNCSNNIFATQIGVKDSVYDSEKAYRTVLADSNLISIEDTYLISEFSTEGIFIENPYPGMICGRFRFLSGISDEDFMNEYGEKLGILRENKEEFCGICSYQYFFHFSKNDESYEALKKLFESDVKFLFEQISE